MENPQDSERKLQTVSMNSRVDTLGKTVSVVAMKSVQHGYETLAMTAKSSDRSNKDHRQILNPSNITHLSKISNWFSVEAISISHV